MKLEFFRHVGNIETYTGEVVKNPDGSVLFDFSAPFNRPVWREGVQPAVGSRLYVYDDTPPAEPPMRHWYALTFQSIDGASQTTSSVYMGWESQVVTLQRLVEARKAANVPADAVVLGVSYLGLATRKEFTGED